MRRYLFLLLLLPLLPPQAVAQTQARMLMGVSGYTLFGTSEIEFEPVFRLAGGGGLTHWVAPAFGIRGELRYTIQGGSFSGTVEGSVGGEPEPIPVEATFDLTYLEIPVMLVAGFDVLRASRIELAFGPAIAIKVDTRSSFSAESGPILSQGVSARDRLNGLTASVDWIFPVRAEKLLIGLRGWRSLTPAGLEETVPGTEDVKSTGITLIGGLVF